MEVSTTHLSSRIFRNSNRIIFVLLVAASCYSSELKAQAIIKFNAGLIGSSVFFSWELDPQTAYSSIEIERSSNSTQYMSCISLSSSNGKHYAWDKQPLPWISFYRLRVIEANGFISYSPPVRIINSTIAKYINQPNGIQVSSTESISNTNRLLYTISLTDLYGNFIHIQMNSYAAALSKETLQLFHGTGPYIIRTIYLNSTEIEHKVFYNRNYAY